MVGIILLSVLISLIIYIYSKIRKNYQCFDKKNIKCIKPFLVFGNSWDVIRRRKHVTEQVELVYNTYPDEDIVGHFEYILPTYVIKRPDYVMKVLSGDFSHFRDRVPSAEDGREPSEPGDADLFLVPGNKIWRAVRYKFSPLFTSGKLRFMYDSLKGCGRDLISHMDQKDGTDVEMFDTMGLFAMDVIGSTAFGIEPNILLQPNSKFRTEGKKVFEPSLWQFMLTAIKCSAPKISRMLGISTTFVNKGTQTFFYDIIKRTITMREESGFERCDFVQMLLQLKSKGKIEITVPEKEDEYLVMNNCTKETIDIELTDNILLGGSFSFLFAGFHSTALTLAFALYELARAPGHMERLRAEIRTVVKGTEPTCDELKNMPFLDAVLKETSRLHPTVGVLNRVCTKDYRFPNGTEVLKGEVVFVPVSALQKDPHYWEEPDEFRPERWEREPIPGTYLPFGDGPRFCIAMRFAMMEMKYALTKLVERYNFSVSEKTKVPIKLHPRLFAATPLKGIFLKVQKIR